MIVIWMLIGAWLGVVVTYALFRATHRHVIEIKTAPGENIDGLLHTLMLGAAREVAVAMRPLRPKTKIGLPKPFPRRDARWGVHIIETVENLSEQEIIGGDPDDKILAAARRLAARAREARGFCDMKMPCGMDFVGVTRDLETGVILRMVRAFDLPTCSYVTVLNALVVF